jgi:superfamily II DNA or RNA helicase
MPNVHFNVEPLNLKIEQQAAYIKAQAAFGSKKAEGFDVRAREFITLETIACAPALAGVKNVISPKADWLHTWLTTHSGKIVVFTTYVDILHWYQDFLEANGYKTVHITGAVNKSKDRYDAVAAFNTDPSIRVILINRAGSDSVDMPAAADLMLLGIPFSALDATQVLGRIRRLSSTFENVNIHVPMAGHLDTVKWAVLRKKMRMERQTRDYSWLTQEYLEKRVAARG